MSASSLVLWIVDIILLPVGVYAFRTIVTSRSWRRRSVILIVPLSVLTLIAIEGTWVVRVGCGTLVVSILLLGSSYRYVMTMDLEDRARSLFGGLDPLTKEQISGKARDLPFHKRAIVRILGLNDDRV